MVIGPPDHFNLLHEDCPDKTFCRIHHRLRGVKDFPVFTSDKNQPPRPGISTDTDFERRAQKKRLERVIETRPSRLCPVFVTYSRLSRSAG
jgi:hypothetical protein